MSLFLLSRLNSHINSLAYQKVIQFVTLVIIFAIIYYFFCAKSDFNMDLIKKTKKKNHNDTYLDFLRYEINLFSSFIYFSFVVQSTIGFGDITPKTFLSRVLVMLQVISSLIIFSTPKI